MTKRIPGIVSSNCKVVEIIPGDTVSRYGKGGQVYAQCLVFSYLLPWERKSKCLVTVEYQDAITSCMLLLYGKNLFSLSLDKNFIHLLCTQWLTDTVVFLQFTHWLGRQCSNNCPHLLPVHCQYRRRTESKNEIPLLRFSRYFPQYLSEISDKFSLHRILHHESFKEAWM
jgi:hypothetical protein